MRPSPHALPGPHRAESICLANTGSALLGSSAPSLGSAKVCLASPDLAQPAPAGIDSTRLDAAIKPPCSGSCPARLRSARPSGPGLAQRPGRTPARPRTPDTKYSTRCHTTLASHHPSNPVPASQSLPAPCAIPGLARPPPPPYIDPFPLRCPPQQTLGAFVHRLFSVKIIFVYSRMCFKSRIS